MIHGYLVGAVVFLVALGGAYIKGRTDGGNLVRGEYAARDVKAAADYAEKERAITDAYRKKEAQWQAKSAAVSAQYQKRIAANETQRLADLAALESRTLVLRDPNAAACAASGGGTGETAAAPGGRDGAKGADLPEKTSRFLLGLANEADLLVIQLQSCQQVLIDERR